MKYMDLHEDGNHAHKITANPSTNTNINTKYVWSSITKVRFGLNYGNYLIEECLKDILKLPEPDLEVDVLQEEFPPNLSNYSFIVNPGCTNLTPYDTTAFRKITSKTPPIICFGGSIYLRGKLWWLYRLKNRKLTTQIARKMREPVGCRDPFTYNLLNSKNIRAQFIGCPTLFCIGKISHGDYIAFSFGRRNIPKQIELLHHLSNNQSVQVLIHEDQEEKYCQNLRVEIVKDVSSFLKVYYNSKCVITGRLHGALPGISANKPVFYFQGVPEYDSRLTLLDYLGLPVQTIDDIYDIDVSDINYDFNKVVLLTESFTNYVNIFKEEFNL